MMSFDQQARMQALNPEESFLIQAPAGSGKTSLLTWRFLRLLAQVEEPEQIIALTFTQKAAFEMRHRVVKALSQTEFEGDVSNDILLQELVQAVKARDQERSWNLFLNPKRLRIMTIDAFCVMINQMRPLSSQIGGMPGLTDCPLPLYRQAVQQLLRDLDQDVPWKEALRQTLLHLDNRTDLFESLFVEMCGIREQWLDLVLVGLGQDLGTMMIASLKALHLTQMENLMKEWPAHLEKDKLLSILKCLSEPGVGDLEGPWKIECIEDWQKIIPILMTRDLTLRKTVTKAQGFLPPSEKGISKEQKSQRQEMKDSMIAILEDLRQAPRFERVLARMTHLPPLDSMTVGGWTHAVLTLLPVLVAYCQLQFQQAGEIDFIEMALSAVRSLQKNTAEGVSDLALAFDYQIHHILVDEFQDTSTLQFRLLEALTEGWVKGDGRSLLCVGDPMQSIYRFRKAEVGLFAHLRDRGINQIRPIFLQLQSNFRSSPLLVEMVNRCFTKPSASMEDGIHYVPAIASIAASSAEVQLCLNRDAKAEAINLCERIKLWQAQAPQDRIAILVRTKKSAVHIIEALSQAGIAYQADGLKSLMDQGFIQDLLALTLALSHEGDHLSWYAILRAPWAGLKLEDLLLLSQYLPKYGFLVHVLNQEEVMDRMSDRAKYIVNRIRPILNHALSQRRLISLAEGVEQTWIALSGPMLLQNEQDLKSVELFFEHLRIVLKPSQVLDRKTLFDMLSSRADFTQEFDPTAVLMMTIHKAKGLEFDRVIIPACEKRTRMVDRPLLLYETGLDRQSRAYFPLLAVLPREPERDDAGLYAYLLACEVDREADERARLLYVAATRAKSHLIFSAVHPEESQDYPTGSFLSLLSTGVKEGWLPVVHSSKAGPEGVSALSSESAQILSALPRYFRTPLDHYLAQLQLSSPACRRGGEVEQNLLNRPHRITASTSYGVVLHEILRAAAEQNLVLPLSEVSRSRLYLKIQSRLRREGVEEALLTEGAERVLQALDQTYRNEMGRWILSQDHAYAASELEIVEQKDGVMRRHVIDRIVINDTCALIVDYKMTEPHVYELTSDFFERLRTQYRAQLDRYERLLRILHPELKEIKKMIFLPLFCDYFYI